MTQFHGLRRTIRASGRENDPLYDSGPFVPGISAYLSISAGTYTDGSIVTLIDPSHPNLSGQDLMQQPYMLLSGTNDVLQNTSGELYAVYHGTPLLPRRGPQTLRRVPQSGLRRNHGGSEPYHAGRSFRQIIFLHLWRWLAGRYEFSSNGKRLFRQRRNANVRKERIDELHHRRNKYDVQVVSVRTKHTRPGKRAGLANSSNTRWRS